jgi:hypothetical protein
VASASSTAPALARRARHFFLVETIAFALRHRSRRSLSFRAHFNFELHSHYRSGCLRSAGKFSGKLAAGIFSRTLWHLAAHCISRALWLLHLVWRRRKHRRISLDRQLDVYRTTLDRRHRLRLHPLAHLHHALQRRRPARFSQRFVWKSASGSASARIFLVLCGGIARGFLALRLRNLVVLGQVGHCFRR